MIPLNDYAGTEVGLTAEGVGRGIVENGNSPAGIIADYQDDGTGFLTVSWQGTQKRFMWRNGLWVM